MRAEQVSRCAQQSAGGNQAQAKRPVCSRCRRPQRVCICAELPHTPISLAGRVIILQHPHETKLKLATVPVLQLCMSPDSLTVVVGRRLKPGTSHMIDQVLQECKQRSIPLLILWPGSGAVGIERYAALVAQQNQQQQPLAEQTVQEQQQLAVDSSQQQLSTVTDPALLPAYVLLAVDSTWRYAKEMFDSLQWLMKPHGIGVQVQLPTSGTPHSTGSSSQPSSSNPSEGSGVKDLQQHGVPDASLAPQLPATSASILASQQQQQQQKESARAAWQHAVVAVADELAKQLANSHMHHRQQVVKEQQQASSSAEQRPSQNSTFPGASEQVPLDSTNSSTDCTTAGGVLGSCSDLQPPTATLPDAGCRLRTEPHESCCTTYEAVSRAVSCLEGPDLLPLLLKPLQLMTQLQAQFDPAVQQRMQQSSSAVVKTKSKLGMRNRLATS